MAAVLLHASKPDGLEQLELVSVLHLTCQELDGGGGARPACHIQFAPEPRRTALINGQEHSHTHVIVESSGKTGNGRSQTCWEKAGKHFYHIGTGTFVDPRQNRRSGRRWTKRRDRSVKATAELVVGTRWTFRTTRNSQKGEISTACERHVSSAELSDLDFLQ